MTSIHKSPRLFSTLPLTGDVISLGKDHAHYLKNVMRLSEGAQLRLFDGHNGEWIGEITNLGKKDVQCSLKEQVKKQPKPPAPIHLLFAPIKKQRMDFMIEKAVELGCTHLHPVLTDHTENRHIKNERLQAQIIEAAEQCERLDIPALRPLTPLKDKIVNWNNTPEILWAAERLQTATKLEQQKAPQAFLIGPEGGFSHNECEILEKTALIKPVTLGNNILRAETAALYCLSRIK